MVAAAVTAASAPVLRLQLFRSGVTHLVYHTVVAHRQAGKRMVEIHLDVLIRYSQHFSLYHESLLGHHGQFGTYGHLGHELSVTPENILVQFHHVIFEPLSERGLGRQRH